jgi:malonyl-CoA/methylmalonyl-CoA synthetase
MSLTRLLTRSLESDPDKVAIRTPGQAASGDWSYDRLVSASRRVAAGLRLLGLEPGERVAFYLGNRVELVIAYLATLRVGAVMVPMNLAYRKREIAHILSDAEPRFVLTETAHQPKLEELSEEERGSGQILLAGSLPDLEPDGINDEEASVSPDDTAVIMYTSGTTGRSKGAVLTHGNIVAAVESLLEAWDWSADDVLLLTLPMFHTHGLIVGLHCALAAGATVRLHTRFDAATVVDALSPPPGATLPPTLFFGVPTMYGRLVQEIDGRSAPPDLDQVRLFCSGSAPLDPEIFHAFERLTGHAILERYGMTETTMLLSNPYHGERRPGTVGVPLPGVSARVVDDDGHDLADGEEGELLVCGANVFSGYWRAEEKTAASFSTDDAGHRWFHTGDLARRDPADGYFTLLGRRHELILSGGFNIYPREVEEVLTSHPSIREAAVVGRAHPEWGEAPVAYLVTDGSIDETELIAYCKEQIASFKVPRRFEIVDSLPRNALGKVQKHLLPES